MLKQFKSSKQDSIHSPFTRFAERSNSAGSSERNGIERSLYSLEYSPNFQRHIIRSANNSEIIESFLWLDEALLRYPSAKLLPFLWPACRHDDKAVNASAGEGKSFIKIAGGGIHENTAYSKETYDSVFDESNLSQVKYILESRLQWNLDRVEKLLKLFPELGTWPSNLLQERIDFLLAPLPSDKVLHRVNHTMVDWPVQFYRHGCGAGLSVEQVSHVMQVMPDVLFRLDPFGAANPLLLPFLYTETPAVVIEMACSQLEPLTGASRLDVAAFAYLHWRGLEWEQCRVLMQAWPSIVSVTTEPSWELYERGGYVRKYLLLDSLWYLQMRLQIMPSHIQAMLKTHSTLSGYSVAKLKSNLNALQEKLCASSAELQKLVLRMPSLLGISIGGLDNRIQFWTHDVSLTLSQLRQAIQRQPALLQYSLGANLRPKLTFFRDDLQISLVELSQMTLRHPQFWGRSLERSIRPMAESFTSRCGNMTLSEYGRIVVRAPELLRCNWQGNIEAKIEFLQSRLGINETDLKKLVSKTPRVLVQSISSSLEPKFALLEERSVDDGREAIRKNPSLLLNAHKVLMNRIMRVTADSKNISLVKALGSPAVKRRPKRIWLLDPDNHTVEMVFADVLEAADYALVSKSHMYGVLRHGKALNGRKFVYATETLSPKEAPLKPASTTTNLTGGSLVKDICRCLRMEPSLAHFTIHVAGRAYPSEDVVRGRRRAGGMALHVPTWTANDWRKVCASLWKGQRLRLLSDGETVLLGYPYILPSRPRCSLVSYCPHWQELVGGIQVNLTY